MERMHRLTALSLIATLLAGCQSGPAAVTPTPGPTEPPTMSQECADTLQPMLDALDDLNARLDIGLRPVEYGERVGDVSVAYSRLDPTDLAAMGAGCLDAGAALEAAFNQYIEANTKWSDCISDADCSTEDIEPTLQGHWSTATEKIAEARALFP